MKYKLPIMLAIWLSLRVSEILGLKWIDIDSDYIHIHRAVVTGKDGPVEKGTKTYHNIPAYIKQLLDAQPHAKEHIINMSEKAICSGFVRICQKQGLPASTIYATSTPLSCWSWAHRTNIQCSSWATPPAICSKQPISTPLKEKSLYMTRNWKPILRY